MQGRRSNLAAPDPLESGSARIRVYRGQPGQLLQPSFLLCRLAPKPDFSDWLAGVHPAVPPHRPPFLTPLPSPSQSQKQYVLQGGTETGAEPAELQILQGKGAGAFSGGWGAVREAWADLLALAVSTITF